jgi:hypothetical protein
LETDLEPLAAFQAPRMSHSREEHAAVMRLVVNEEERDSVMKLERLATRDGGDQLAWAGSMLEIACQCGRSACAEVIALPRFVYEPLQREPRRLLLSPGHELPGRLALSRCDSFVLVAQEEQAAAASSA